MFRSFIDVSPPPPLLTAGDFVVFGAGHGSPYPALTELGYDVATASVTGAQAIRDGATQSSSNIGHYDFDLGGPLLGKGGRALYDAGDLDLSATEGAANRAAIAAMTRGIVGQGGVPVPCLAGYDEGPLDILQIDAHIDWCDSVGGEKWGYSSTMRRASERGQVRSITQVGMRGVGSARPEEVQVARDWGAQLVTVEVARLIGPTGVAALIPEGGRLIVQIDLDALDPSVCGAVNAPTPGGFAFGEVAGLLRHVIGVRGLAGLSVVELVPGRDLHGLSAIVAARLICNAIGAAVRH